MYDLICDVMSCCVRSCDVGKINVNDQIVIENQKKRENIATKDIFYTKDPSNSVLIIDAWQSKCQ